MVKLWVTLVALQCSTMSEMLRWFCIVVRFFWLTNDGVVRLHSAAAGDAEGAGNGGENGDDEVDDVF